MGGKYASKEMEEKVKKCISQEFLECNVVNPHRIKMCCGIDREQAEVALTRIAPNPGEWVDIGAKSKLTRCRGALARRGLLPWRKVNEWFYDPPEDALLPVFPYAHEFVANWLPRIHVLLHSNRKEARSFGGGAPIKTC